MLASFTFHPSIKKFSKVALLPSIGLLVSIAALADTSGSTMVASATAALPSVTLDKITVTARGIEEDTLETPFVVNTITSQDIVDGNYVDVSDALRNEPSIDIHSGGNVAYSMLWMRGTGSLSMTSLDDNSVDIRVDGISHGKTGLARNLIDVDTIEVAKGPQGTLHGSSSEAGSISIKTVDPEDYFGGKASIGFGSRNQKLGEAILNVPLSDNVSVRVAGMLEEKDNYFVKSEDGEPLNQQDKQGVNAKIRWHDGVNGDDSENNVVLGIYHDKQTNNVPTLQKDFDTYKIATYGLKHESESTAEGITLSIDSNIGFANLTSKTGYHTYFGDIHRPLLPPEMLPLQYDLLGIPPAFRPTLNAVFSAKENNRQYLVDDVKQISQELTLSSKPDSDIKWVAGLYFTDKERDWHNDSKLSLKTLPSGPIKGFLTNTTGNGDSDKSFDNTAKAIFGEVTYPATHHLDVIAGIRVANEKLTHHSTWQGNSNNALATSIKSDSKTLDETATTGRFGLNYAINPNWHVYALQSRGHKPGGFADYETNVVYDNPLSFYKPTVIDASEIGTKYRSADNRLSLGIALYRNNMEDDHISVIGAPPNYLSQTANVDSRSQGLELSADWQVTDKWQINTELAYTDAEVTDASNVPNPQIPGQFKLTEAGHKMPQVPEYSGSLGIGYHNDLLNNLPLFGSAQWFANANYRYVGKRYAQSFNVMQLDSYGLVDASLGIGNSEHELSLWGKNLTDENYIYIGVQPGGVGIVAPDRSYGVKYSYYY